MTELILQILPPALFSWATEPSLERKKQVIDFLTIIDPKNYGKTIKINTLPIIIGKYVHINDPANIMIHYTHTKVSNKHAIIYEETTKIKIKDVGTKTGTIIQRKNTPIQVTKQGTSLQNEDIIILGGEVKIKVLINN